MGSRKMQKTALVTREAHQAPLDLKKLVDTATQKTMTLNWRLWVKRSAICSGKTLLQPCGFSPNDRVSRF
jgi:hypothetical protein